MTTGGVAALVNGLRGGGELDRVGLEILSYGEDAVEPLAAVLLGLPDPVPHPRQTAARLLGVIGTPGAVRNLQKALRIPERALPDPVLRFADETVAETAANVLAKLRDSATIPSLRVALERFHLVNAAEALAAMEDEDSIPLMIDALGDDFHRTRLEEAILSFGIRALPALGSARRTLPRSGGGPEARRQDSIERLIDAIGLRGEGAGS